MTEGIFTVALLENTFVFDSFGTEKAEGRVFEDGGVLLRLAVIAVFIVAKDDNTGFGSVRMAIFVGLDDKDTHRW
jgi:hypothetical protein